MKNTKCRIRIAVIGLKGLPAIGGAARTMENILERLKSDYDFTVYSVETHTDISGFYNNYNQIVFKGFKNKLLNTFFYYWKCLIHALLFGNYDFIHMHHATSGYIIPFIKIRYNVVTTLHGVYTSNRYEDKFDMLTNLFFRFSQYFCLKFSDVLVSVSKYEIPFCKKRTYKPIFYIPNGINKNENVSRCKIGRKDYLLFAAARIYRMKGCDLVLRGLSRISYSGRILVIGDLNHDINYKRELLDFSKNLDVEFLSLVQDKRLLMRYIKNARIFIFPSRIEAMSNMLLEVASMKCPIVCSDIPANKDIFEHDDVIFFKNGDFIDFSYKIEWALNHPKELKKMKMHAYKSIVNKYLWEDVAKEYDNLYRKFKKKSNLLSCGIFQANRGKI